ncbi:hypothetical protein [Aquipuribacter hungaricus]|uniref:Uncharacterized protein n=1 Tax=Aquipuribacter hungaricus TaxID=545624 RepID=A0ABV7WAQ6_9MICO
MTLTDTPQADPAPARAPRRRGPLVAAALLVVLLLVAAVAFVLTRDPGPESTSTAPAPAPAPEEPAEPAVGPGEPLSWAPPVLEDPTVVEITAEDTSLKLDQEKDYELVLPDEPLVSSGGLSVYGGRNVVMVGGEISVPPQEEEEQSGLRALYLRDQTGTVHIEGVKLTGEGLGEGINLDQREGAVVQLQNIWVGEVFGTVDGHHGDLIQAWAGPAELRVDGLTGSTGYQGFFLLPKQFGDQPEPELFDLRRVDITGAEDRSAYMLWRDDLDWPLVTSDVWVDPTDADPDERREFLWDREGEDSWADVQVGTPPGGPFVPEDRVGLGYASPGYAEQG